MALTLRFWGVRGSIPRANSPAEVVENLKSVFQEFARSGAKASDVLGFIDGQPINRLGGYGGDTTAVEFESQNERIIIDGGTGIRSLGLKLLEGPCGKGAGKVHIFFTHFHWDHIMGLPFFTPIYIPGNEIHFYSPDPDLEMVLRTLFRKPFFPVPFEALRSKIVFHKLPPRTVHLQGDLKITPYLLDHPDPCWGYRIEHDNKAVAYCVDTECTRSTREELGPDLNLYKDAQLMVFDAQYSMKEVYDRINWGHSVAAMGLDIAFREKIRRVIFTHHDPAASAQKISQVIEQTLVYHESERQIALRERGAETPVEWVFAYDGMQVVL